MSGRKDVVGEVKGIEMMGVLVAGRGARERGGRRLEVIVYLKITLPIVNQAGKNKHHPKLCSVP